MSNELLTLLSKLKELVDLTGPQGAMADQAVHGFLTDLGLTGTRDREGSVLPWLALPIRLKVSDLHWDYEPDKLPDLDSLLLIRYAKGSRGISDACPRMDFTVGRMVKIKPPDGPTIARFMSDDTGEWLENADAYLGLRAEAF